MTGDLDLIGMKTDIWFFCLVSLSSAVLLCHLLAPIARRLGWGDTPDWCKQHTGDIPLAGGPAMFLAVFAVIAWAGSWSPAVDVLAWSSAIIFLTGLVDDRDLSPRN